MYSMATFRNREELAWAAGFFDGEGCTTQWKARGYTHAVMKIGQKDRFVLDRFGVAVGCGKVYGPSSTATVPWRWETGRHLSVVDVLALLRPWLSPIKIAQAEKAIATSTWNAGQHRGFEVNHPGHEIRMRTNVRGDGQIRYCRTCNVANSRRWRAQQKVA